MLVSSKKIFYNPWFWTIFLIGGIFLIFNFLTPSIVDDYTYAYVFGTEQIRITSLSDIVVSQYNHWLTWGGRNVTHFCAQLFLWNKSKVPFNICNTAVYLLFVFLICYHAAGSRKKITPLLFIIVNALFWFLTPDWGEVFIWLTGSCNYLWGLTLILLFFVPFRRKNTDKTYHPGLLFSLLFFIYSILAGWTLETGGAATLCLLILYFTDKLLNKEKLTSFEITGTLGLLIGLTMLTAAPGNYVRAAIMAGWDNGPTEFFLLVWLKRFINLNILFLIKYYGAVIFGAIALLGNSLFKQQKKSPELFTLFYFAAGLASLYAMVLVDTSPGRLFYLPIAFFIIVILSLLRQFNWQISTAKKLSFGLLLGLALLSSLANAGKDMLNILRSSIYVDNYIRSQKALGIIDIEIPASDFKFARDKHTAGNIGITYKAGYWTSIPIARFYGVKSIKLVE
jgi:hypothetical protein